jgi:hypothetical protein
MASDKPAKRQKIMSTSDDIVQVRVSAEHKLFYFQRDRLTESSLFSEQLKADPNIITFDDVDLSTFLAFTKLIDGEQIALESITADPVNIDKLLDMYAFAEKLHHVHSKNAIIDKIQDILKASNGLLTFDQFKRSFDITQPSEIRKTYRFEKNSAMYLTEPLRKLCAGLISERLALDCHIELAESVCMEIPGFLKEVARYQNEGSFSRVP